MNHELIAQEIYEIVGPAGNIRSVTHCMTRLRLYLVQRPDNMESNLQKIAGVLGVNDTGDELQIILGPGTAASVTDCFTSIIDKAAGDTAVQPAAPEKPQIGDGKALHAQIRAKNATPVKLFFKRIASIFMPLIPAFIACGLTTGLLSIAAKIDPSITTAAWFQLGAVAGNVVFWSMNLFIGYNTAKEFGGSPILGGILGGLISHPGLAAITLGDTQLVPGRGGVISVLLVAALGALIEKRLQRLIPDMFSLFLVPLLTFLIAGPIAICVLQPLGGLIATTIGTAATAAVQHGGALTGFVLGGLWLPLVMLGIHQAFTPIHVELLSQYGMTILLPILAMAGAGQVGASFAVFCKTKNAHLKKTVASALPVGIMGIGEPLIYGVTLPLGKPFLAACIGGAFGGAVQAAFAVGASALGISGLPLAATTNHVLIYLLGVLTAYVAGFIAAWLLGFDDPADEA
ncbi:PTS system, sucrose-specific IIC component [Selenomonas sp. GACV-9]|uniref:PTS transporter subunit EIIC n=1 Tax=Selenomonas sp. GACV-9 TaxID=3158782 RepID=UPI0008E84171|nr:PTS system, sucrose-specific IIC component [Selenomonas ruminantium]